MSPVALLRLGSCLHEPLKTNHKNYPKNQPPSALFRHTINNHTTIKKLRRNTAPFDVLHNKQRSNCTIPPPTNKRPLQHRSLCALAGQKAEHSFVLEFSLPAGRQVWLLSLFQDKESDNQKNNKRLSKFKVSEMPPTSA